MIDGAKSEEEVAFSKISEAELEQIQRLVDTGVYLSIQDFIGQAIRDKLTAIKVIKCRDVDFETAKKEIADYFHTRGEAYASDANIDLGLDYDLVCKIMDDLENEGKIEALK